MSLEMYTCQYRPFQIFTSEVGNVQSFQSNRDDVFQSIGDQSPMNP